MQVMSFNEFKNLIAKLEERGKTKTSDFLMYLVLPFLKSLGYNVYELDEVDMDMEKEVVTVKNKEDLKILVSINQNLVEYKGIVSLEDNDIKIYINIGLDEREIKLYYNVLEKWEEIVVVDLEKDNADVYAKDFTKRIAKEVLNREVENNGKKFLTEKVLDTRLDEGHWDNDFTMYGLLEELTNPTDEFVRLMAGRLAQDYTTQDIEWITERLEKAKEEGFSGIINRLSNKGYFDVNEDNFEDVEDEQEIKEQQEENEQENNNDEVEDAEEDIIDNITNVEEHVEDEEVKTVDDKEEMPGEEDEREEGFTNIDNYLKNVKESKGFKEEGNKDDEGEKEDFPSIDGLIGSEREDTDIGEDDDTEGEDFQDLLDRT